MSLLEMRSVSKAFGGAVALKNVDFTVGRGEIHALLGENGAGKSTLMNILTGVVSMDGGRVVYDGNAYPSPAIRQMERAGIAFVHQERNVVNDLAVFENIFLNRELKKGLFLDKKAMVDKTRELFEQLDVNIDPLAMVSSLRTGEKQLLEICRALYTDAGLIILDEPTTALSNDEIDHLFKIVTTLRDGGKSFIFISHKMVEIFAISDRYTVLRNGEVITTGDISETSPHAVTLNMVGEQYANRDDYTPRPLGDVVLSLRGYTGGGFSDVNLGVRQGEVVAFTGLAGCGASEVMQAMFGALPTTGGHMELHGKTVRGGIHRSMKSGVAMLPSGRKENSVVSDMNILENFYIAEHTLSRRSPMVRQKDELARFEEYKQTLQIKSDSPLSSILSLSGGNQQKAFLARWLNTGADVLLFDNPTQGVDVGAKAEIYRLILALASEGKTIIINTLEIPEISKVSDRCVVFYNGGITKIFNHNEIDEHTVMLYSTNAVGVQGKDDSHDEH